MLTFSSTNSQQCFAHHSAEVALSYLTNGLHLANQGVHFQTSQQHLTWLALPSSSKTSPSRVPDKTLSWVALSSLVFDHFLFLWQTRTKL